MPTLVIGLLGFILFFIYDYNDAFWKFKKLNALFALGFLFVGSSVISEAIGAIHKLDQMHLTNYIGFTFALVFLGALIYTLFFALPFKGTYIEVAEGRKTYTFGVYALCRHPGFGCFIGLFFFLFLALPFPSIGIMSVVLCILNFLYVLFQDAVTFPKIFKDYDLYKLQTPFLIPNFKSIRICLRTLNMEEGHLS